MLSPDDRLLIQILLGLGVSQTGLLLGLMLKVGRIESTNEALNYRVERIEKEMDK